MAKKIPYRRCVGCGEMKDKKEMIRVIRTPEEEIVLDETGKKNGRGAYICKHKECLQTAQKSRGLERALKHTVSDEIYANLIKEFDTLHEQT